MHLICVIYRKALDGFSYCRHFVGRLEHRCIMLPVHPSGRTHLYALQRFSAVFVDREIAAERHFRAAVDQAPHSESLVVDMSEHLVHQGVAVKPHAGGVRDDIVSAEQRYIVRCHILRMRARDAAVIISRLAHSLCHRDHRLCSNVTYSVHVYIKSCLCSLQPCLCGERLIHQRFHHGAVLRIRFAESSSAAFHRSVIYDLEEIHPEQVVIILLACFQQRLYPAVDNSRIFHMTRASHEPLQIFSACSDFIYSNVILIFEVTVHPHVSRARNAHRSISRGIFQHQVRDRLLMEKVYL